MSNRREFIATATGGMAVASIGAPALAAATAGPLPRRLGGSPTREVFEALRGHDFTVVAGDGQRATLRLVAVDARASGKPLEQFTLQLEGNEHAPLASGLYRLNHAKTGRFSLRLEPGGDASRRAYHADCSLLV